MWTFTVTTVLCWTVQFHLLSSWNQDQELLLESWRRKRGKRLEIIERVCGNDVFHQHPLSESQITQHSDRDSLVWQLSLREAGKRVRERTERERAKSLSLYRRQQEARSHQSTAKHTLWNSFFYHHTVRTEGFTSARMKSCSTLFQNSLFPFRGKNKTPIRFKVRDQTETRQPQEAESITTEEN